MLRYAIPIAALLVATALPATAQDHGRPAALVGMQPLPETETPDIDALLRAHWRAYYNSGARHGFFRDQVRAGRIDLNEDGQMELLLLIDSPDWQGDRGRPLLVAHWTARGWAAIGWGFADSDGVFVTTERAKGWATIETPTQWLHWTGSAYRAEDKPGQ
ncbi:hypothetical protein [Magnetospirillum sp. SS-4]|uniref:hypothetical protein n=1 Tax=Magnetospirillum sp. SS-4 TaxID=2681465 RepID=UPI00137FFD65|nr:hypothetical protein [Magnetospirillum sp. SS-4]CAA7627556.1 conserved exported hypothetical protein [Magnetospirillum sp. SS-4]